jgi:hypothetical protein
MVFMGAHSEQECHLFLKGCCRGQEPMNSAEPEVTNLHGAYGANSAPPGRQSWVCQETLHTHTCKTADPVQMSGPPLAAGCKEHWLTF